MGKGPIEKKVGKIDVSKIDSTIVEKYNLEEYDNLDIVQDMSLYMHTLKHSNDFKSIDNYNNALSSVEKIIKQPIYVFFDKDRNSLLYFKELDEHVCTVVKLKIKKNKKPYVATIYPVNKNKIEKLKEKELRNKYIDN